MIQTGVVSFYQERGKDFLLNYRISSYKTQGFMFSLGLQLWVLLEITKFHLPSAGIIRIMGIIRGRSLFEEIRYLVHEKYFRRGKENIFYQKALSAVV